MVRDNDPSPVSGATGFCLAARCTALEDELAVLRAIFETIPVSVYAKDCSGRYMACNRAFEELFASPPGALNGKTARDILPPRCADWMQRMDHALCDAGGVQHFEQHLPEAGADNVSLIRRTVFPGPDGEQAGIVGMVADITELKRVEAALRASETRYRALFDNLIDAILVFEILDTPERLRPTEVNAAALRLLGLTREAFFATYVFGQPRPADGVPVEHYWQEFLATGRVRFQAEVMTANGLVPVQIDGHRFRHEGRDLGLGIVRNMSVRRAAEAALRKSEARFRAIFEHAGMGVVVADTEGYVLEANQALVELLGYSRDELRAMPFAAYTVPEDVAPNMASLAELKAGLRDSYRIEKRYRRKDGRIVWAALTVTRLPDEAGTPLVLGIIEDITARRQAEAERAALNERLEALVAARTAELSAKAAELAEANALLRDEGRRKSVFLSAVSHELRTPLTSILGFAALIERDFDRQFGPVEDAPPESEPRLRRIRGNLEIIRGEGERLSRLVNDVLDMNRLETGLLSLAPGTVDLLDCIRHAARIIAPQFAARPELNLRLELPDRAPPVWADRDRLLQVFLNLLGNALKFTERGAVTVGCRPADAGRSLAVTVADNGIGIPEAEQVRIFTPFHQGGGAQPISGTGLGLAISRLIIELMGGRILVASTPGRGSTFSVILPVALAMPQPSGDTPAGGV